MAIRSHSAHHKNYLGLLQMDCSSPCALQIAVVNGSGEGNHVADVAHAREIHDAALEAQAEAGVTGRAVLA